MNVRPPTPHIWTAPRAPAIVAAAANRATPPDRPVAPAAETRAHLNLRPVSAHILDIRV